MCRNFYCWYLLLLYILNIINKHIKKFIDLYNHDIFVLIIKLPVYSYLFILLLRSFFTCDHLSYSVFWRVCNAYLNIAIVNTLITMLTVTYLPVRKNSIHKFIKLNSQLRCPWIHNDLFCNDGCLCLDPYISYHNN